MAEYKERTKEEWAIAAAKELAKTKDYCDGSLDKWQVIESGRQYQVLEGGRVVFSNKSIWKVRDWVMENVRYPYSFGKSTAQRTDPTTGAIARHYDNLYIPNHPKDTTDYSLTDKEKTDIKTKAIARTEEGISILEDLVKPPHLFFAEGEYTATTVKTLSIVDAETGEVLKQGTSPWVVKLWYEKVILKSWE